LFNKTIKSICAKRTVQDSSIL